MKGSEEKNTAGPVVSMSSEGWEGLTRRGGGGSRRDKGNRHRSCEEGGAEAGELRMRRRAGQEEAVEGTALVFITSKSQF